MTEQKKIHESAEPALQYMSRYMFSIAVAERAKMLHAGAHALIETGPRLNRPIDVAMEEVRRGLLRVELSPRAAEELHAAPPPPPAEEMPPIPGEDEDEE